MESCDSLFDRTAHHFLKPNQFTPKYLDSIWVHSASSYGPKGKMGCHCKQGHVLDWPAWLDEAFAKKRGVLVLELVIVLYFPFICLDRCRPSGFLRCSRAQRICPSDIVTFTSCSSHSVLHMLLLFFSGCRMRTLWVVTRWKITDE